MSQLFSAKARRVLVVWVLINCVTTHGTAPAVMSTCERTAAEGSTGVQVYSKIVANIPKLPKNKKEQAAYEEFIRENYGMNEGEKIEWIAEGDHYIPTIVYGSSKKSFFKPKIDKKNAIVDISNPTVVIIGSGASGLSAAQKLLQLDEKRKVAILEAAPLIGGVANAETRGGVTYSIGGAYFSIPEGIWAKIAKDIRLWKKLKQYEIHEPIDSYYLERPEKGGSISEQFYVDLWSSEEIMEELPANFAVFMYMLKRAYSQGDIYIQPIAQGENISIFGKMTMGEWMDQLPVKIEELAKKNVRKAKEIFQRYREEVKSGRIDANKPMADVFSLLDIYGRSALGKHAPEVNAAAFMNFYISEVTKEARYTGNRGSGTVTRQVLDIIENHPSLSISTSSPVGAVEQMEGYVNIYYLKNGRTHVMRAEEVVYASQLKFAPEIIEGMKEQAPELARIANELEYVNYLVINIHTDGHVAPPSYDTWVRQDQSYTQLDITDIIDGRWMDFHGIKIKRDDNRGVLTVYYPLPKEYAGSISQEKLNGLVLSALTQAKYFTEKTNGGKKVKIVWAKVNLWSNSIHIAGPDHFTRMTVFENGVGRVHFAHSNMGAPSVEEAMVQGDAVAQRVHQALQQAHSQDHRPKQSP